MRARDGLRRAGLAAVSFVLLLQAACVAEESPRSPGGSPADAAAATDTTAPASTLQRGGDAEPEPCPSETLRSWSFGNVTTRRLAAYGTLDDVAVSQTGTATVAWTLEEDYYDTEIRTMDVPAAPSDPQSPAGPPDPQHRHAFGGVGVDASDAQTLLWLSDELGSTGGTGPYSEHFDVVVADREPGGQWSSSPTVLGAGYVWDAQLAVNPSGAAVVGWLAVEPEPVVYAAYREAAGAAWTHTERLARNASLQGLGIDDAGRVLLLFSRGHTARTRLYAVRRGPTGGWGPPTRIAGGWFQNDVAVGADGSAVVVRTSDPYDRDSRRGSQFTLRMTPSGRWQPRVRQPALTARVEGRSVDMDAKGRVLMAWWDGTDLVVRWSRPGGRWRRPCVLAAGVKRPGWVYPDAQVTVNRGGDALVVWGAKGRVRQLWARYKPAGQGWSESVRVTRMSSPPGQYVAELGEGGHAAIAWMPRNGWEIHGREIHVVRTASPGAGRRG